jgi:hypothetical protein
MAHKRGLYHVAELKRVEGDCSLSYGSCTGELWLPVADLPIGRAAPAAQKLPGIASRTRVGGLPRQDSGPASRARGHTEVISSSAVSDRASWLPEQAGTLHATGQDAGDRISVLPMPWNP